MPVVLAAFFKTLLQSILYLIYDEILPTSSRAVKFLTRGLSDTPYGSYCVGRTVSL